MHASIHDPGSTGFFGSSHVDEAPADCSTAHGSSWAIADGMLHPACNPKFFLSGPKVPDEYEAPIAQDSWRLVIGMMTALQVLNKMSASSTGLPGNKRGMRILVALAFCILASQYIAYIALVRRHLSNSILTHLLLRTLG